MKKAKKIRRLTSLISRCDSKALASMDMEASLLIPDVGKEVQCDHDWQRDGQTMMAIRWSCPKCGKTMLV